MQDFFDYHTHNYKKMDAFISIKAEDLKQCIVLPEGSKFFLEYHPWNLSSDYHGLEKEFIQLAESDLVYGIGEVGLDKLKQDNAVFEVQLSFFEELVELSAKLNKPLMLHLVRSWSEARKVLEKYKLPQIYLHGFYGKIELLREILNFGIVVSLNPKMIERSELYTFLQKNPKFLEQIKLETDDTDFDIKNLYANFYERLKNV